MDKAASSAAISREGLARVLLSAGLALAVFHLPFLIGNGLPYYLLSAAAGACGSDEIRQKFPALY